MSDMLLLALEGIPPGHVASNLVIPIASLIFGGAMFALLWSNYGAKIGGLILGVATFGFMGFIGVFWWFGAPGTPIATGPQNFPGQAANEYLPAWFPFQPGSDRAEFFPITNEEDGSQTRDDFLTLTDFAGTTDDTDPQLTAIAGDLDAVSSLMIAQYFPTNAEGQLQIGANRRTAILDATPEPDEGYQLADPAWSASVISDDEGEPRAFFAESEGQRIALAELQVEANFVPIPDPDTGIVPEGLAAYSVQVETSDWFAFKDPGAIWLPSAVWTGLSFLLFGLCLAGLDRIEQRAKREEELEVEEPLDVEVPIAQ